ncbi:response regulator [Enterobacter sp. Ap-916]|uniref:response regulator n=1 Tax=Enterobacteriaceae TaxID=543 RepID=UPI00141E54E0|nr:MULTISPECIES: response regulator [unclassified Enterobacter]NIF58014.1 response regulator [Enterobacter sp. Ap-867]NIG28044.1 response regulator [Enterobacter sp. Ap-916]
MKNVLIVDDHPVARLAVRMVLEKENLTVIAETDDGLQAIQLVRKNTPDLVIVDIDIPSVNGIDVVQRMRRDGFSGGILVLTGKEGDHYIRRCASAGADGFVSKKNNLSELSDAVRAIRSGYGYFPRHLARSDVAAGDAAADKDKLGELSAKELDVLRHLAKGVKVVDIARQMNISDKTVSTYKSRLMAKLGLKTMIELYDFTQKHNLD